MFRQLKPPRDEEKERLDRLQAEKLFTTALHMFESAVQRHDDAMTDGHYEEASEHSQIASWWYTRLTGCGNE